MKYQKRQKAIVLLADGTIFYGKAVGNKQGTGGSAGYSYLRSTCRYISMKYSINWIFQVNLFI